MIDESPQDLTPAHHDVLEHLGAPRSQWPEFDPSLRTELRHELESSLESSVQSIDEESIYVSKHALGAVHGCEGRYLAEREFPGWSVPLARGSVTHKAIELSIHWRGEPAPADLVDEALASLEHSERGIADFLQTIEESDRAQLRGDAIDAVSAFAECWPPLLSRWRPRTESTVRVELFEGKLVFQGKIDLSLGRAEGTKAGKVLVDLKTGQARPTHLDDLRFYALLETIRIGVPPRKVASYYLDQARFHAEEVHEEVLFTAAARTAAAVRRMIELEIDENPPALKASVGCRWCRNLVNCSTGQEHIAELDQFG